MYANVCGVYILIIMVPFKYTILKEGIGLQLPHMASNGVARSKGGHIKMNHCNRNNRDVIFPTF